jgi:hypothetical protein
VIHWTAENAATSFNTTFCARLLLMATVMLIPLQDHFPGMSGFGFMFVLFGLLGLYAFTHYPSGVDAVWFHPVFVMAYVFIALTMVLESASPQSKYEDIIRFALMVGGAIFVATLCRDRPAITACLYGYIGAGLWLAVVLFGSSYGALQSISASDYTEASVARSNVMSKVPIKANPNGMAFNCVQGGVIALAFALRCNRLYQRALFLAIAVLSLVASSLAMSRGGIAIGLVSCGIVLYVYGWKHGTAWLLVGVLACCVLIMVPSAVWTRMEFSVEGDTDQLDSRSFLYSMAMQTYAEYALMGVGSGNSEAALGDWSTGVHNSFIQITINWGLIGLLKTTSHWR